MILPLQVEPGMLTTPLGKLLLAVVGLALVIFVGRYVLEIAWRLLRIAAVVILVLWLLSVVIPTL